MSNEVSGTTEQIYGCWNSPLSARDVFRGNSSVNFLRASKHGLFYIDTVQSEDNAQVLMHLSTSGTVSRISAPGINVRSQVHEYGGLPYASDGDFVYYCSLADQPVLRQRLIWSSKEHPETEDRAPEVFAGSPEGFPGTLRYADFTVDRQFGRLLAVREDHRPGASAAGKRPGSEAVINSLVAIDLDKGGEGEVLFCGSDFVAAPRLSRDGRTLAWLSWSHPDMPWDSTRLNVANLDGAGRLENTRQVQPPHEFDGCPASLLQPLFDSQGHLYFIADWTNWWNLYRVNREELNGECRAEALCPLQAEFAQAPWLLGHRNYALVSDSLILAAFSRNGFWSLALIDLTARAAEGRLRVLQEGFGQIENIVADQGRAWFTAASPSQSLRIHQLENLQPQESHQLIKSHQRIESPQQNNLRGDGPLLSCPVDDEHSPLAVESVSTAQAFSYRSATASGSAPAEEEFSEAHGLYYPPHNPACRAPAGSLPPLLVCIHGGPTSTARPSLNLLIQYWTSRGFAVTDINHRGSTGYGRRFRRSLYGNWGKSDLEDILGAVDHLVRSGLADPRRVAIRGGSAGGYAVLAALVSSRLFGAGASYYGVSDFEMLARDTHKFESRYLDQLLGPYPEARQIYIDRSPLHRIDSLSAPLLLLQGSEDKVVPPSQSQAIYDRLREKPVEVQYLLFEGEGHGFRRPDNQVRALETELAFYRRALKIDCPDEN